MSNNCERVREQLSAFDDGELAREEALDLERHLSTCADCRVEREALRESWKLFKQAYSAPSPAMSSAEIASSGNRGRFWSATVGALCFACALFVFTQRTRKSAVDAEVPSERAEYQDSSAIELTLFAGRAAEPLETAWAREIGGIPQ